MTDSKRDAWILLKFVRETGSRPPLCHPLHWATNRFIQEIVKYTFTTRTQKISQFCTARRGGCMQWCLCMRRKFATPIVLNDWLSRNGHAWKMSSKFTVEKKRRKGLTFLSLLPKFWPCNYYREKNGRCAYRVASKLHWHSTASCASCSCIACDKTVYVIRFFQIGPQRVHADADGMLNKELRKLELNSFCFSKFAFKNSAGRPKVT